LRSAAFSFAQCLLLALLLVVAAALSSPESRAQTQPDAGQLLLQQPKPPTVAPSPRLPASAGEKPAEEQGSDVKVKVNGFRIEGAVLIAESELVAQLQRFVGQELAFSQLQGIPALLTNYYSRRGLLARAILPPQDIKDGIVRLRVVEARQGSVRIDNKGERVNTARVQRLIDGRMSGGPGLNMQDLSEALVVLNEQPGVEARSSLAPGAGEGDVNVLISASDKPLFSSALSANNQGSRGTGVLQFGANASLSNISGAFDVLSVVASATEGSTFGRADYSLAAGDRGLRLGLTVSELRYRLTQSSFAALQASGSAGTIGMNATYPISRQRDFNLSFNGSFDSKSLIDRTLTGETSNRLVSVASVGISGYVIGIDHPLLEDGVTNFGLTLTFGNSDQRNTAARTADSTTRRIQGGFAKVGYTTGFVQELDNNFSLGLSLRGQFANKNLDSSERLSLGGPSGVRAYPVGESSGDEGWLASVNVGYKPGDSVTFNAFLDSGGIKLNHTPYTNWNAANPALPNRYELYGVGVGIDWRVSREVLVNLSVAAPLGDNPGRDTNGTNSDGSRNRGQAWLGVVAQF